MQEILIADDSKIMRLQLSEVVKDLLPDVSILQAVNGPEVLRFWSAASPPLLTVLDIHMPVLGGLELLRHVVGCGGSPPPVIIYTASRDESVRRQCLDAGAMAVVIKSQQNIYAAIRGVLMPANHSEATMGRPSLRNR